MEANFSADISIKELLEALKHCSKDSCDKACPVFEYKSNVRCDSFLMSCAVDVIEEQDKQIFQLENRLKECENGYEGTLFLERCKRRDAEEKIAEVTSPRKERIVDRFNREIEEVIGTICDDLCRYARENLTQEELDERCEKCPLCRL